MATFRDLVTPVKFYRYFWGVFTFGTLRYIRQFRKRGNWAEFTFAKTSGTVTRDREKNWPIAD